MVDCWTSSLVCLRAGAGPTSTLLCFWASTTLLCTVPTNLGTGKYGFIEGLAPPRPVPRLSKALIVVSCNTCRCMRARSPPEASCRLGFPQTRGETQRSTRVFPKISMMRRVPPMTRRTPHPRSIVMIRSAEPPTPHAFETPRVRKGRGSRTVASTGARENRSRLAGGALRGARQDASQSAGNLHDGSLAFDRALDAPIRGSTVIVWRDK